MDSLQANKEISPTHWLSTAGVDAASVVLSLHHFGFENLFIQPIKQTLFLGFKSLDCS